MAGITAALASAASWAAGALLFKRIGQDMSSPAMTLTKGVFSLVLLGAVLAIFEARAGRADRTGQRLRDMDKRSLWLLAGSGLLGIAVADTCFFQALKSLTPFTTVLAMMVGQILTPLLAVLFLRERATPIRVAAIALVVAGVGLVLWKSEEVGVGKPGAAGIAFALASVVSMSVSYIMAKKVLDRLSALQATFLRMLAGTAGILVLGLAMGRLGSWWLPLRNPGFAGLFLASVGVVTFGGFWLSLAAFKYADAIVANTLVSTEPLFVILFSFMILGTQPTPAALAGSVLGLAGVYLLCRERPAAAREQG